jgi:uncharacterized membrane protein YqiK
MSFVINLVSTYYREIIATLLALLLIIACRARMVVYIPNSKVGVVERLWSRHGSVRSGFIALDGEAGYQPDILRGGIHFFAPYQYRVHKIPLVTIMQGEIGYVFARDGMSLRPGQTLASNLEALSFDDTRTFLLEGGQKGPQRQVLREGTYAMNLAQFIVLKSNGVCALSLDQSEQALFETMAQTLESRHGFRPVVIKDGEDSVGVVTVHDGPSLPGGEIIAPTVGDHPRDEAFHNSYQDADAFLRRGYRGRQYQVLTEGSYFINRLFATVEMIPKTIIPVGHAGVVVSYTGAKGVDLSSQSYRHGELVAVGERGVWAEPMLPGKYAFNTYAGSVQIVPTTNFILKWSPEVTAEHRFDVNLKEVSLITRDAFEPLLPLSVVVHIDYQKAPLVVQRFGDVKRLVEQTLDPMVSAYFKNTAQTKTLIELLQERSQIQEIAANDMRGRFADYSLELQEVLIGTPRSAEGDHGQIEEILRQLRDRQIAVEQVETFQLREKAATQERTLREAEARAAAQGDITRSMVAIEMRQNEGKAAVAFAGQDAERVAIAAGAESNRQKLEGQGLALRIAAVGAAEAQATRQKVEAFGGPQYQLTLQVVERLADAIKSGQIAVVPQVQVGGTDGKGSMIDALLGMALRNGGASLALPPDLPRR